MLAGKGFSKVYNLSGGIKAWTRQVAVGPQEVGMHLFAEVATGIDAVVVGFALEMGLRDFYLSMQGKVARQGTKDIFARLAEIEVLHQRQLLQLYGELSGEQPSLEDFATRVVAPAMEGGMSTAEYLDRYQPDLNKEIEVLSLAMAIEAQALDLYLRAAEKSRDAQCRQVLQRIAEEERGHIAHLSAYIDSHAELI